MDVERSSLCNCVVNFLLEENYLLSAFELLQELLDDGRDAQAIRLKEFFSDPAQFPPDQISRFNTLRVADPQTLLEEKELLEEKLAISEYELRLAQEDILRLKEEVEKKSEAPAPESNGTESDVQLLDRPTLQKSKRDVPFSDLGPLKDNERRDLNCAVKEYLLLAGYRLTTMTFYEEVIDQNLDVWQKTPACVPDALRHYYYQYLSSTDEAAEEKISILRENESLRKQNEQLNREKESLLKMKDLAEGQIMALTKSLETLQKDVKDRELLLQDLKKKLELERTQLNDCRAEITSLKMHIEGNRIGKSWAIGDIDNQQSHSMESYKEEIKSLQMEIESLKAKSSVIIPAESVIRENENVQVEEKVVEIHEDNGANSRPVDLISKVSNNEDANHQPIQKFEECKDRPEEVTLEPPMNGTNNNTTVQGRENAYNPDATQFLTKSVLDIKANDDQINESVPAKMGVDTIQILSDALPKIVPYVLINHREELLPLIMCAIERHPDSNTRDSLTHTLFNLIKRPDEQQRRIIMEACVSLAKNVGEMRTESELLPQCWEQINHTYEERRLLVAQSCGELAEFVRPEIRDSLILSIVQQLLEDSATVVREAAAHNLALLLPLFPNMDKYFKVEELMFQLVCDPSGVVVDTSLKELVPAMISWGNKLDNILRLLLNHILGSAQRCAPLSGVQGSIESYLRVLGERERWNIDVLLRMLTELLPSVHQKAIETCPFPSVTGSMTLESGGTFFSTSLLELYAGGHVEWPAFDWIHTDCFADLIQLACLLPQKEDNLRLRITKFLLAVSELFGEYYLTHIMLPVFLVAVGDNADLRFFPSSVQLRITGLQPNTSVDEKLAIMCVLPLLLAGILGASTRKEQLAEYLRKLLVQNTTKDGWSPNRASETIDAVRFLCTFDEHHGIIFNILWEMVVSSNINMKMSAANLLKVLVPYIDAKVTSTHVLPALVTLGSDQNLSVKYASIEAFGAVAQHFKTDMIVDKIRVQMDAFLEDGSHEATVAVIRALVVAVPHTTDRLRDYLLSKIFHLTTTTTPGTDIMRRRERANAFCEAIRALDATDLPVTSVREYLLPTIQNLLKDHDTLDPAHKEALEIIMKERSGGTFETITKVMGMSAHLGLPSSMSSFFGDGGILGKKESGDHNLHLHHQQQSMEAVEVSTKPESPTVAEDTRFRRIMRGNFGEMLRGKGKGHEEAPSRPSG